MLYKQISKSCSPEHPMKGYKATRLDGRAAYGRRRKPYAAKGLYHAHGELQLCGNGLHFCIELCPVYMHYNPSYVTRVFEVTAHGPMVTDDMKCCVKTLRLVRELTPHDIVCGLLSDARIGSRANNLRTLVRLVNSLTFGPGTYVCAKDHDLLARAAERRLAFVEAFLKLGTDSLMRNVFNESLSLYRLRRMRRELKAEAARSARASTKEAD